ncbi:MAG: hypothetical protein EPO26_05025 [Chloroflexota bacterium]|nr:MAG: hypothetical protein EPO26_05025 [Chloroflexota bacterium]
MAVAHCYAGSVADCLLYLVGAASEYGDGARILAGLTRYLIAETGIEDAIECSYRSDPDGCPTRYERVDTSAALDVSVGHAAAILGYHRRRLGVSGRLHLLGWSLGGVILFEAATRLVAMDRAWHGSFGAIVTLGSPLNGCDADGVEEIGAVAAGDAGRELIRRAADPGHRARVADAAKTLTASGARVVTLGAAEDVVVTPEDSIVARSAEERARWTFRSRPRLGSDLMEQHLGHGAILHDPAAWRIVRAVIRGEPTP